jgi:hypothetical protein
MLAARVPPPAAGGAAGGAAGAAASPSASAARAAVAAPVQFHPCLSKPLAPALAGKVAMAPPPSIELPSSLFAAAAAARGGSAVSARGVDVQMVQWGRSPYSETAGLSTLR